MSGRLPSRETQDRSSRHSSASQSTAREPQEDSPPRDHPSDRISNPNVFSDDYSLEPLDPPEPGHIRRSPSISSTASSVTLRSSNPPPKPSKSFGDEPESLSNPFDDNARSSFDETTHRSSLPRKGGALNRNSSVTTASSTTAPSVAQRSMSSSSHFSIPRALSPYTGATGPSHPYAMYPQVGVGRSPSVASTSTVRPVDRPPVGLNPPQHPYAMYPQNIVVEEGFDPHSIPVGFPGHAQVYRRAPGQGDDDVADIIGPDGHLEQLPPYTRYPDGIPPKMGMGPASIASANRDQDFQLGDGEPPPSASSRTLVEESPANRPARPPVAAETAAADSFDEKGGRRRKHRTCCGVPIWMLVLIAVVLLIGAGIGGAIGGVIGTESGEKSGAASASSSLSGHASVVTVTATAHMDATPLATIPPGLLPVPTGHYQIPASIADQSKFCIPKSPLTASWSCMTKGALDVNVSGTATQPIIEFYSQPIDRTFTYGAQAPIFPTPTQTLSMMLDKGDMSLGPALFFYTEFDKLVIVQEDVFPTTIPSKRSVGEADLIARQWSRKQVAAQPGDKPWFCWWNNTIMEFFLYINETTHDDDDGDDDGDSDGIYLGPTTTFTATGGPPASTTSGSSAQSTSYVGHPTRMKSKRDHVPNYPRRIKIEEKRGDPSAQRPYCQQMQVMNDGTVQGPISPIQIGIDEIIPPATTTSPVANKRDAIPTKTLAARGSYESTCYCVWLTD